MTELNINWRCGVISCALFVATRTVPPPQACLGLILPFPFAIPSVQNRSCTATVRWPCLAIRFMLPSWFLSSPGNLANATHRTLAKCRGWESNPQALFRAQGFKPRAFSSLATPASLVPLTNWRRGSESNRCIRVLQTLALPLGYRADERWGERGTRATCATRAGGQNAPSDWKSTWPPTRRMLTPSGWFPSLSSRSASVERLAGESPAWYS